MFKYVSKGARYFRREVTFSFNQVLQYVKETSFGEHKPGGGFDGCNVADLKADIQWMPSWKIITWFVQCLKLGWRVPGCVVEEPPASFGTLDAGISNKACVELSFPEHPRCSYTGAKFQSTCCVAIGAGLELKKLGLPSPRCSLGQPVTWSNFCLLVTASGELL